MAKYLGNRPTAVPLTSADIQDGVITAADLGANSVDSSELVDNSVTLAKMASGTDGNVISYDASGNPVAIATGSDGEVLTSAGAGQPPAFEAAAGFDVTSITGATALAATPADTDEFVLSDGGVLKRIDYSLMKGGTAWDFLYTDTQSSEGTGSVAYTEASLFTSTYDTYRIYIANWIPGSDGCDLSIKLKIGGSTRTDNYAFHKTRVKSDSSSYNSGYSNTHGDGIRIMDTIGNAGEEVAFGWFEYYNPSVSNGEAHHISNWNTGMDSSHKQTSGMGGGVCRDSTATLTGFTLYASCGGLGAYNLYAYGLKS